MYMCFRACWQRQGWFSHDCLTLTLFLVLFLFPFLFLPLPFAQDITDVIELYFCAESDDFGQIKVRVREGERPKRGPHSKPHGLWPLATAFHERSRSGWNLRGERICTGGRLEAERSQHAAGPQYRDFTYFCYRAVSARKQASGAGFLKDTASAVRAKKESIYRAT